MSRRELPACETCNAPIARPPFQRAGDRMKFCSMRCAGQARRVVHPDEICLIASARRIGVTWTTIAREVGASTSSLQRALKRARLPIALPRWVQREERSNG